MCATEALDQLSLDRVLLLPVHTPPHKEADADPGVEVRVRLCEAAVSGEERLLVSRVEADVPGRSFTVDTLRGLHERRPEDHLTFIVGGDMAHSLPAWREPEAILDLAEIGVAEREDLRRDEIAHGVSGLRGASGRMRFFEMPRLDISSSLIRSRVAAGRSIRYLVPDAVADVIEREGLYR